MKMSAEIDRIIRKKLANDYLESIGIFIDIYYWIQRVSIVYLKFVKEYIAVTL